MRIFADVECEHVERLMKQEKEMKRRIQEEQDRALKRQNEAQEALERMETDRRERNRILSESLNTKQVPLTFILKTIYMFTLFLPNISTVFTDMSVNTGKS